tara:strand:- start:209 stop:406 length:198 start_codon:yes stop_codon:yes gene_type:complete
MSGQKGTFCPLNKTSKTIPNAISDTPTSAKALDQSFILNNFHIISPLYDLISQNFFHNVALVFII